MIPQPSQAKRESHLLVGSTRRDTCLDIHCFEKIGDSVDRLQLTSERSPQLALIFRSPLRNGATNHSLDLGDHVGI